MRSDVIYANFEQISECYVCTKTFSKQQQPKTDFYYTFLCVEFEMTFRATVKISDVLRRM